MARPYKARSLPAAQRRVRELSKSVGKWAALWEKANRERRLLAKLAAEGPAFDNPIEIAEAKKIRDAVLREICRWPDGKRMAGGHGPPYRSE